MTLGARPLVVGVISLPRTLEHPLDLKQLPFDVAELRIDLVGVDCPDWLEFASRMVAAGTPVILTVRHPNEGGHWYLDEQERAAVYRTALPFVSAIDVEIGSEIIKPLADEARRAGKLVIGSFHDFEETPDEAFLRAKILDGRSKGADVVKLATMIQADADLVALRALLADASSGPLCLLGMGDRGAESRVSLAVAGSCLAYGYYDQANAPGQLSAGELRDRLRKASALRK
ncbi:MAG: type I 3-dehydroquinate dehydratase [bacterium]